MRANAHGDLDLTREPLQEARLAWSDIGLIVVILAVVLPCIYYALCWLLELAVIAEG